MEVLTKPLQLWHLLVVLSILLFFILLDPYVHRRMESSSVASLIRGRDEEFADLLINTIKQHQEDIMDIREKMSWMRTSITELEREKKEREQQRQ